MALPRVTGVVWWRMGISHYKAVFRRAPAGGEQDGYTKDFLQAPLAISDRLHVMFGGNPPWEPITYVWPGGSYAGGKIYPATEYDLEKLRGRLEVGQWTQVGAPTPWQVGNPSVDSTITFPGDPEAAIPVAANAQWDSLEELEPWLMLVQLDGRTDELHLRAYLGSPPVDLLAADLGNVPPGIRRHMGGQGGLTADDLPELWFDTGDLRDPWRLSPDDAGREASRVVGETAAVGVEYHLANETPDSAESEPFSVDPKERERALRSHAVTQNALAAAVAGLGRTPLSPAGTANYDVGWMEADGTLIVAEVKSLNARNEERQLRLGLGQILRYRHAFATGGQPTRALLVTSSAPSDERWIDLCAQLEVGIMWPPGLDADLQAWLGV